MKNESYKLERLLKEYQVIHLAKKRSENLAEELNELNVKIQHLEHISNKEYRDIELLEAQSLKNLFSKILQNHEEQLEKERQEYLIALLNLRSALKKRDLILFEMDLVENKIGEEARLLSKLNLLLDSNYSSGEGSDWQVKELINLNEEIKKRIRLKSEIWEAKQLVDQIVNEFQSLNGYLQKAKLYDNWGTFYNDIQYGKEKKMHYLDRVEVYSLQISRLLVLMNKELKDVIALTKINLDELEKNVHFELKFYSSLISDWILGKALSKTQELSQELNKTIVSIAEILDSTYDALEKSISKLEEKRQGLLTQMADNP